MNGLDRAGWVLMLVIFALGAVACDTRAKQEGERGNLQFYYLPADQSTRFDRPLAVGSGMVLYMEPLGDREFDRVVSVSVEPEGVLSAAVAQEDPRAVVLSGQAAGTAKLSVEVQGGGARYSDAMNLEVAQPRQVSLSHQCTREINAAYLVGQPMTVDLKRYDRDGELLVGSARSTADPARGCQVAISPGDFQQHARCDEAGLHLSPINSTGPVKLELAQGTTRYSNSPRELGVQMISPQVLDFDAAEGDLRVNSTRTIELKPVTYGEAWPVCSNLWMRVFIDTPHTCTGENGEYEFDVEPGDENSFRLRGVAEGYCEFAVMLPALDDIEFLFDAYVEF